MEVEGICSLIALSESLTQTGQKWTEKTNKETEKSAYPKRARPGRSEEGQQMNRELGFLP
jgi:hypothetical protein